MKLIKASSAALAAKRAEIDNISAQIQRAQAAIDAGIPGQDAITELQNQRSAETGRAFIEGRPAELAAIDKQIARLEKEATDAKAAIAGAHAALTLLTQKAAQAQTELWPLQQAQDAAINEFAAAKDREAQQMLATALEDVERAFELMQAAYMVDRTPVDMFNNFPAWRHRMEQFQAGKLNFPMKSQKALDELKATLSAAGVEDPGVKRVLKRERELPSAPTPEPVVRITVTEPANEAERAHQERFGTAVRVSHF